MNGGAHVLYICSLFLLFSFSGLAQRELKFEVIDQKSGLSVNSIGSAFQDSRGYIWFATGDGLNMYDGVEIEVVNFSESNNVVTTVFESSDSIIWVGIEGLGLVRYDPVKITSKVYRYDSENIESLSSNKVTFIDEDLDGNIWISTHRGGFDKLDVSMGAFRRYSSASSIFSLSSDNVSHFHMDRSGNVWVGTQEGVLNLLKKGEEKFIQLKLNENSTSRINEIYGDQNGNVWIGSEDGLYQVSNPGGAKTMITRISGMDKVTAVWEDNQNNLWVSSSSDLWIYDRINNSFTKNTSLSSFILPALIDKKGSVFTARYMYQTSAINSPVLVDDENQFWFITNEGLNMYNPKDRIEKRIRVDDPFTNISSNQINSSFKDESGILWFSTAGGGICKFNNSKFYHYQYKKGIPNALGSSFVLEFHENADGTIWVGTNGGLFSQFDPVTEEFEQYKIPNSRSIVFDIVPKSGNLWLATSGDGLVCYQHKTNEYKFFRNDPLDPTSIGSNTVQRLYQGKHNNFLVGTDVGLHKFNLTSERFELINLENSENIQPDIFAIYATEDNLWLGTLGQGLIKMNIHNPSDYEYYTVSSSGLPNNSVTSVYPDPLNENILWIGTYGGGLVKFNTLDNGVAVFTTDHGLPNNVVYNILHDEKNNLWLSSNAGLTKFDLTIEKVSANYDIEDGLQANEFNRGAHLKLRNGKLLFGGINGFNLFDPKDLIKEDFKPRIHFNSFNVFGEEDVEIKRMLLSGGNEIVLDYKDNFFTLEFATLDYRNSRKNQYKYRLVGLNSDWTMANNRNPEASYTNLDPGTYTFQLMATNSDGIWLPDVKQLSITINPPFYGTALFKLLAAIFVLTLILTFHYSRIQVLRKQRSKLNLLVRERTKTIDDQNLELSEKNKKLKETVSQLKETQAQLIESEKMASLGVLSAGVGHEINNPLNFIRGGIHGLMGAIENKTTIDPKIKKFADIVNEGVNRTSAIVKSLGHFSRSSTVMTESCNLPHIIDNCLVLLESRIKGRVKVTKKFNTKDFDIIGNEGRLHQAFLNILSNSEQAINGKGSIQIEGSKTVEGFEIKIQDDGVGIDEENLGKVMDPFFTTKAPGEGTGLGLSITFHIIKEHHGEIEILSEGKKGTSVLLRFPVS